MRNPIDGPTSQGRMRSAQCVKSPFFDPKVKMMKTLFNIVNLDFDAKIQISEISSKF